MSVDTFRQTLKQEIEARCKELGKSYDKEPDRGYAFELWVADLLIRNYEVDIEPETCTYRSKDLLIDLAFDDEEAKALVLGQCKFVSPSNPDISESDVVSFFDRHEVLSKNTSWVRDHASDELHDLISDYPERLEKEWNISFYFITTGKVSERIKNLVAEKQKKINSRYPTVALNCWDFYNLKEEYIRSKSIEASISEAVELQFGRGRYLFKDSPYRTLLAIVKGTQLTALYKKERERLFAYNIRSVLGKRVNKTIIDTAGNRHDDFYYFNNGVSAVCTRIHELANIFDSRSCK